MHIRRVVTSTDGDGKSFVLFDGAPTNTVEPFPGLKSSDVWETTEPPFDLNIQEDVVDRPNRLVPPHKGTICKVFSLPPKGSLPEDFWPKLWEQIQAPAGSNRGTGMHKTNTVDYVVCIEGEMHCILDTGTVCLRAGEVLVQLGTHHAWENYSDKPATIIGVLVDNG